MMERLKNWFRGRLSATDAAAVGDSRDSGSRTAVQQKNSPASVRFGKDAVADPSTPESPENRSLEKNTVKRKKFIREDTGTHETLTILDDSLPDSGDEEGIDPYNTGGFDRSKNWNNRFRD